jgi:hypothetical protein
MANLNPNSTNYFHSYEPNTNDLTMAMDYDRTGRPIIRVTDAVTDYTSKNRTKISPFETVFFNTFQYGKETDVWDEATTTGGSATFDPNVSGVVLAVDGTLGAEVIRQTKNVMRYIPGRSAELSFGIRLEPPVTGIRRRFGLFDENNGAFFEDGGDGNYYCCIRNKNGPSGPTLNRVPREQWNGDKLDGLGISGIVADPAAQQLVDIEYEWYGAGAVIFKFVIDGHAHVIHTFYHANRINTVWCATPFLPIRVEITNVAGTPGVHKIYQGSNSLISEGEVGKLGIAQNFTTTITGKSLGSPNTFRPVLSIRLKPGSLTGVALPTFFQAISLSNASVFYKLVLNAELTDASFTDMPDPNSFTQYDQSATAYTGGRDLDSGYVSPDSQGTKIILDRDTRFQIGRSSMGTVSDILTLVMASPTNNATAVGSMTWIEQR